MDLKGILVVKVKMGQPGAGKRCHRDGELALPHDAGIRQAQ